jgi:hypothetical protein
MSDQPTESFRLLALLEGELLPRARGRNAFLRPPELPQEVLMSVRVPTWNWTYRGPDYRDRLKQEQVLLDANAAYVSAASSFNAGRDALQHTGPVRFTGWPGFYQVVIGKDDPWQDSRFVSPLGQYDHRDVVWLTEPTVTLLFERAAKDELPEMEILDSWTTPEKCRLLPWTNRLRAMRADLIHAGDKARLKAFKLAYAEALEMVKGHEKCKTRRPDWYHGIRAQNSANLWRKGWNCALAGHGPVASGSVDTLTLTGPDLDAIQSLSKPPVRLDQSGVAFGTYKVVEDQDQ